MTKDEALAFDLALEALEVNNQAWKSLADSGDAGFWEAEEQPFYELSVKAITAIKQARSAPVQEPVWIRPDDLQKAQRAPFLCRVEPNKRDDFVPLYAIKDKNG
jgi:hypothetical protein